MNETRQVEVDGRMVFDHRVEIRDQKTGKIVEHRPYILHINKAGSHYEWPPHSGRFYDTQGVLVKDVPAELTAKIAQHKAQMAKAETAAAPVIEQEAVVPVETEVVDPIASAEAEAQAILQGTRNIVRRKV